LFYRWKIRVLLWQDEIIVSFREIQAIWGAKETTRKRLILKAKKDNNSNKNTCGRG